MKTRLHTIAQAALLALIPACDLGDVSVQPPDGGVDDPTPDARPPIVGDPIDQPARYERRSLKPLFEITPQGEFDRFDILGESMTAADFTTAGTRVSIEAKLRDVGAQIAAENNTSVDLLGNGEPAVRAQQMPFRGNPTDVKLITVGGQTTEATFTGSGENAEGQGG